MNNMHKLIDDLQKQNLMQELQNQLNDLVKNLDECQVLMEQIQSRMASTKKDIKRMRKLNKVLKAAVDKRINKEDPLPGYKWPFPPLLPYTEK